MDTYDWDAFDLDKLAAELRADPGGAEGERLIWAFEEALRIARAGDDLLARAEQTTPRTVLEGFFRRSASDESWRERYLPLFQ